MKTKIFTKIIVSIAAIAFFASCGTRKNAPPLEAITDEGVVINGVRWATRNADGFRTFVSSPEMAGGFYAWHFDRARDRHTLTRPADSRRHRWRPCPPGWRLPTKPEFESLVAAGSVWTEVNGVYGRLFGTEPNQLFLPVTGEFVDCYPYEVSYENELGVYWLEMEERTWMLRFCQGRIDISVIHWVRCETIRARPPFSAADHGRFGQPSSPFEERVRYIPPELSIRCVAVTAND